ncbi:MAG: LacI family DNA-binding transcriptional regulator [Rhizobiaceae bacterium]|nr:LacI family DNA-binding transcriptional regulator [Rhizobiaceae bacterium]
MAHRATISDVARAAGVSVATVDRVLNGRQPVREDTARRVLDAAESVGFHARGLIHKRLERDLPKARLGFILQKPGQFFYREFARQIEAAAASLEGFRVVPVIDYAASQAPVDLAAKLREMAGRADAIAMVAPDHPTLAASVASVRDRGVPVYALLSDFATGIRDGYFGVSNLKVGRTAAWMIARLARRPGKVALFVGSHRFQGHELREVGFRSYFREHAPQLQVLDTMVNLETRQISREATIELLHRHPDLVGLYVAGGGMEGAIQALREEGRSGDPIAVVNENTPETRAALADAVIVMAIATPLADLCRDMVHTMVRKVAGIGVEAGPAFLPFDILLPENI